MGVTLGQIVISKAGRDSGRKFVVVKLIDELNVLVSDGDLRKLEKPKKKKLKHLEPTVGKSEALALKLESGARMTNAEIRKVLAGHESAQERSN